MSVDRLVAESSVLVCAGAGGVGKTTTAAALAMAAAKRGRRAIVVTIDPAKRLADAMGVMLSHDPSRVHDVGPGELWAVMLDTTATFDSMVRRDAKTEEQAERILANRFYRNISGSLSGTQEYMAGEKLHELHSDDRFDLVVVDTPPTRNALDFLDAPARLVRFFDHRLYRTLVSPTNVGMRVANVAAQAFTRTLARVVGADAIGDAIEFFRAFEGMEAGFRTRALAVIDLLQSPETGYVLVTSPRREAVDDAVFFASRLRDKELLVSAVVANRVHPMFGPQLDDDEVEREATRRGAGTAVGLLWSNLQVLRAAAASERAALAPLLGTPGAERAAVATVPLLDHDVHDLRSLSEIAEFLVTTDQ